MTATCGCGREIIPATTENSIILPGGWCAPSEVLYQLPEPEPMCADCRTRMHMISQLGIDPGKGGENLRVQRGGSRYPTPTKEDQTDG